MNEICNSFSSTEIIIRVGVEYLSFLSVSNRKRIRFAQGRRVLKNGVGILWYLLSKGVQRIVLINFRWSIVDYYFPRANTISSYSSNKK